MVIAFRGVVVLRRTLVGGDAYVSRFGITNLVTLVALIAIVVPIQILLIRTPVHLTPEDWSYWGDFRREWPLTVVALVLFASLFLIQPRLARSTLKP